jgi:hypothetical protein
MEDRVRKKRLRDRGIKDGGAMVNVEGIEILKSKVRI